MEALRKEQQRYTYVDYLTWNDGERYELINGVPYMMSSPSQVHQEISMELSRQVSNFLILNDGVCIISAHEKDNESVPVHILNGCTINLKTVFSS